MVIKNPYADYFNYDPEDLPKPYQQQEPKETLKDMSIRLYNEEKNRTQIPQEGVASTATPGNIFQDLRSPEERKIQEQLNAQASADFNTPINEEEMRRKTTEQFQGEIDALNRIYAEQKQRATTAGMGRLGQVGAIQARRGLLGSDFGVAQQQTQEQANLEEQRAIENEQSASLAAVQAKIRNSVADQLKQKKEAASAGANSLLAYYKGEREAKAKQADAYISNLVSQGLPADTDTLDLIAKSFGISTDELLKDYNTKKATQDASKIQKPITLSAGETYFDPNTKKSIFQAPFKPETPSGIVAEYEYYKQQEEASGRPVKSFSEYQNEDANRKALASSIANASGLTTQQSSLLSSITSKYQADALVQAFDKGRGLEVIADQVLANPNSATNQLKSLYALVKNLDPDSAVREGEIGLANKANSYFQNLGTSFQRLTEGQVIAPKTAIEMANATKELVQAWKAAKENREARYKAQSDTLGVGDAFNKYLNASGEYLNQSQENKVKYNNLTEFLTAKPELKEKAKEVLTNEPDLTDEDVIQILGFNQVGSDTKNAKPIASIKLGSNLAIANNNPGNLRFARQTGASQGKGGFARFNSPLEGFKALINQVALDASRNHTVESFINKYAPPIENNTKQYISQFVKALGVSPNEKLKNLDPQEVAKWMAKKESSSIIS